MRNFITNYAIPCSQWLKNDIAPALPRFALMSLVCCGFALTPVLVMEGISSLTGMEIRD
jgi:hypothetical protein